MLTGNTISVTTILERLFRTSFYTKNFNILDAVELAGEFLDLVGVSTSMTPKITNGDLTNNFPPPIKISGFKGILPPDLLQIRQTRNFETKEPMRYSTDTFHSALHCEGCPDLTVLTQHTYTVQPGKIVKASFQEGYIEMSYYSFPLDEFGMPFIPAEERYVKGVESYVKEAFYRPLWEGGKIPDKVYEKALQDKDWYMGSAHNFALMQNVDQFVNVANYMINLIPDLQHSSNFFRALGEPEVRWNNSQGLWNI
jgi:hypothetical protein